jgi:hypothetical protein
MIHHKALTAFGHRKCLGFWFGLGLTLLSHPAELFDRLVQPVRIRHVGKPGRFVGTRTTPSPHRPGCCLARPCSA